MTNKLDLLVGKGNGYNSKNRYAFKFDIVNHDTSSVALSALKVVSYGWMQERLLDGYTSGVNAAGTIEQWMTSGSFAGQNGIQVLDRFNTSYRIYHSTIDSTKVAPQLTINAPSGGSDIGVASFTNNTDTYFDIILPDVPPTTGYSVAWYIPAYTNGGANSSVFQVNQPTITFEKLATPYIKDKKADTKIIVTWPSSTQTIPVGYKVTGVDVYIEHSGVTYYDSSDASTWYSIPTDIVTENKSFNLEQNVSGTWTLVTEYLDDVTIEVSSGISPDVTNTYTLKPTITSGSNNGVYIGQNAQNPIASNAIDKDNLSLWSSQGSIRRSLIKFDVSSLPSTSAAEKAILRLNVKSLTNAWNYSGAGGTIAVYRVIEDWVENEVTWTNRKASIAWTTLGGSYDSALSAAWVGNSTLSNSFTSAQTSNHFWTEFDITTIVNFWKTNPTTNYGLLIKLIPADGENFTPAMQFELSTARDSVAGIPNADPTLLVAYTSAAGPITPSVQTVSLISPVDGTFFKSNATIQLSATANVSAVDFYKVLNGVSTKITSAVHNTNWGFTLPVSSVATQGSTAIIYAIGYDSSGSYTSNQSVIKINGTPQVEILNPTGCHTGSYTISAKAIDPEGYNSVNVDIIYNGQTLTQITTNTSGYGSWTWPTPPDGSLSMEFKAYDSNPLATNDYSVTPFTLNIQKLNVSVDQPSAYQTATFNGINYSNIYVVPNNLQVVPHVSATGSYTLNYWIGDASSDGTYNLKYVLASATTSAAKTLNLPDSKTSIKNTFQVIVVEAVSPYGCSTMSSPIFVYVRKSDVAIGLQSGTSCSNVITVSGVANDTDANSFNPAIIDNSVLLNVVRIVDGVSETIDTVTYFKADPISFTYDYANESYGTVGLGIVITDSYGLSTSSNILNLGITQSNLPQITLSTDNVYYTSGNYFIVSATSIVVSAIGVVDKKDLYFTSTDSNGNVTVTYSNDTTLAINVLSGKKIKISSTLITNGLCESKSQDYYIIGYSAPVINVMPDNCASCYCDSTSLNVYVTIQDRMNSLVPASFVTKTLTLKDYNYTVISTSAEAFTTENIVWNVPYLAVSGADRVTFELLQYSHLISVVKMFPKVVTASSSATMFPIDYSVTNYTYSTSEAINFSVVPLAGAAIKKVRYYIDDVLESIVSTGTTFAWTKTGYGKGGLFEVKAVLVSVDNCETELPARYVRIGNGPGLNIEDPIDNEYLEINKSTPIKVIAKTNSDAQVSAVSFKYNAGVSALRYTTVLDRWTGSFTPTATGTIVLSANATDTKNVTSQWITKTVTVVNPTQGTLTVSGTSSISTKLNSEVPVKVVITSSNGSNVTDVILYNGSNIVSVLTATGPGIYESSLLVYTLTSGVNSLSAMIRDSYGIEHFTNSISITATLSNSDISTPIIKYISSDPESRVSSDKIRSVFEIGDYTNKIVSGSINISNIGEIVSIEPIINSYTSIGQKYQVTVDITQSGSLTISAMNYIGRTASLTINNYVRSCGTGRQLNLTRYLPEVDRENGDGSPSEMFEFTKMFENYLNTIYTDVDSPCNISTLEKTSRLQNLHNIDKIENKYIPYYANMLGYNVGINESEMGTFSYNYTSAYTDTQDEYSDKILRFVVGNLPNWYNIKTTRNSLKILLLSFGFIGDVMEYYTTNYSTNWIRNRSELVDDNITSEYYPTPHISVGIDLLNSPNELLYESADKIKSAVESIRPANVVLEGISGYIDKITLPSVSTTLSYRMSKTINVPSTSQINTH